MNIVIIQNYTLSIDKYYKLILKFISTHFKIEANKIIFDVLYVFLFNLFDML